MRPAFQIDLRDPERALSQQNDLINRDAARSKAITVAIPVPQTSALVETSYLSITTPFDDGTTLRNVRLIPTMDYRIAKYGASVLIGAGLRTAGRFELLGREWDSSKHALVGGTPFDLVSSDQPIRSGIGIVVRVVRNGWPATWPLNASVEATVGYDPGA